MDEDSIIDMLAFIKSRAVSLEKALEKKDQKKIDELLNDLSRQTGRLYRKVKKRKDEFLIQRCREIAAEIKAIKKGRKWPARCMGNVGEIIYMAGNRLAKEEGENLDKKILLERYFNGEKLTKEELQIIIEYRKKCIGYISKKSTKYSEVPTNLSLGSEFFYEECFEKANIEKKSYFVGRTIVDLGAGPKPSIINFFKDLGLKKYIGVDIESPPSNYNSKEIIVEGIKSDILSYLITLKDDSVIVISSGVMIFSEIFPEDSEGINYLKFLAKEINRVISKDGFTLHIAIDSEVVQIFNKFLIPKVVKRHKGGFWVKK